MSSIARRRKEGMKGFCEFAYLPPSDEGVLEGERYKLAPSWLEPTINGMIYHPCRTTIPMK